MADKNSKPSSKPESILSVHFHSSPNVRFAANSDENTLPPNETTLADDAVVETPSKEVQILVYPRKPEATEENTEDSSVLPPSANEEVKVEVAKSEGFSILIKLVNAMYPPKARKDPDPDPVDPSSEDQKQQAKIKAVQSDGLSIIGKVVKTWAPRIEKVDAAVDTADLIDNIEISAQTSEKSVAYFSAQTSLQSLDSSALQNVEGDLNISTQASQTKLRRSSTIETIAKALSLYEARKVESANTNNKKLQEAASQYERRNKSFSLQTDPERDVTGTQTTSDLTIRDASELSQSLGKVNDTSSSSQQTNDGKSLGESTTQTSADYSYSQKGDQLSRKLSTESTILDPILENGACPKCELIMRMLKTEGETLQNDAEFLEMVENHKLSHLKKAAKEKNKLQTLETKIDQLCNKMDSLHAHKNGSPNDLPNAHSSICDGSILCDVAKLVAGINRISKRLSCENSEDLSKHTSQVDSSEGIKRKDGNGKGRRLCSSNCHLSERKAGSKECSEEIISRKYYHSGGGCCIQRKCDNENVCKVFDREDRKCQAIQNECYCNRDRYQRKRCSIDDFNCRSIRPQTAICGCRDRCDDDHYSSVQNRRLCSTACESRKYHDDQHHCSYHKNGNGQNRRLAPKLVEFISETAKLIQNAKEAQEKEPKDKLNSNLYKQPGEAMNGIELEKEFQEIKSSPSSRKNSANADVTNKLQQSNKADQKSKSRNSILEEMTFQIIPSPAQKDKEKESQQGKEKESQREKTEGGNPAETTNLNYNPPQLKERHVQSSTNFPATKRNVNSTDNNENTSSLPHPFGNGSSGGKITIENPQLQRFIGDVLSAINEIQEDDDEDPLYSSPCSRETSCDNCVSQKSETMPLQHATDFRCRTRRPRVCTYFIPICSSNPSQCQPYCHSNQVQDSRDSIMPLQESFQQNNTVCFQRVQWREQRLTNSRQSTRQAQQCHNQINDIQGLRRCPPPSTTAGSGNRQRGLRNVGQQQSTNVSDTITYFVPPNRTYWQNM